MELCVNVYSGHIDVREILKYPESGCSVRLIDWIAASLVLSMGIPNTGKTSFFGIDDVQDSKWIP
jgi:hypothetical protein